MSTRGVGFLLILTVTIALGALAQDYRFDVLIAAEHDTGRVVEWQIRDLKQSVAALQGAMQASVASGQTSADWLERAAKLKGDVESTIATARAGSEDTGMIAALDAAADALKAFKKTDAQVRTSLQQEDRLRASDLIFMDEARAIQTIHESLDAARARNRQLADDDVRQLARLRLAVTGVSMLFVLAVAVYFGRATTMMGSKAASTTAQMVRDLPPAVKPGSSPVAALSITPPPGSIAPAVPAPAVAAAAAQSPASQAQRPTHLAAAAELCVDLAKVMDAQDVPALLERTASVLDAKGVVFWAIDADGARLRASMSHGYSDRVLAKLRPLQIDGDNVTSLAYRSLQPQTMNGATPADHAALAIPLMTGTGCVGVMAVELRHNRPHADLLPVARILGAQFSMLIAAPDDASHKTANG